MRPAREDQTKEYPYSDEEYLPRLFQIISGLTFWSTDKTVGNISDVQFKNIKISRPDTLTNLLATIATKDESGAISNICFENFVCNDRPFSLKEIDLKMHGNVEHVDGE